MPFDYSTAPPPRDFELIPRDTIVTLVTHLRPGGAGEGGLLKRSKDGGCEMLDVEYVVVDGTHARRKFWGNMVLAGTTDGHAKAADISRGRLKQMLDSAHGLKPDDTSPQARTARTVRLGQLQGLTFIAKIGIEKGAPKNDGSGENWPDKNVLAAVITPDKRDWHPVEQPPPFNGGGGGAQAAPAETAAPIARPGWAS